MATQTAPVVPVTLSAMTAAALQIIAYNTKLRTETILPDVFETLSGTVDYSDRGAKVPDAIFLKLEKPVKGAHSITVPLLMRLKAAPKYGTTALVGTEETLRLKHMTVYYNLIRKAVATEEYGVNANDVSAYDLYGQVGPLITDFISELRGRRIREASLLTIAEELTQAPISLSHRFNSNIFVPNTVLGGMPVSDPQDVTEGTNTYLSGANANNGAISDASGDHVAAIGAALHSATNGFANPEYCTLNIESLLALDYHCTQTLRLEPIMIGGKPTLVFVVPAPQMIKLLNPTGSSTNIGYIWKELTAVSNAEQNLIPNAYCRVRNLVLVEDSRYATLTVGGHAATPSYTLTPGFLQPGNYDGRNTSAYNSSSNLVFEVGCVYGKGALVEWIVQPLKYATEAYDYEMVKGKGAYQCAGIQLVEYNVDNATASDTHATKEQHGSCIVIMSQPSLVTVS